MNEEMGCFAIILVFFIGFCAFMAGLNFGNPGELVATKPQCEIALNQERCVDTLYYVTKPYTKRQEK